MNKIVSGRYRIVSSIGTGGMAVVYRAWDDQRKCEVALKVLRPEYQENREFVRRFEREAIAASRMSHENIVRMFDVGIDGDMRYIVMEYIDGRTLRDVIQSQPNKRVAPQTAVRYALKILAALDHAHRMGIIHRDIKPQNILVDQSGVIKVADFGIARLVNDATGTITDTKTALGSVHYVSPEQASGQKVDAKSDLYSLGVVLYEMLTGTVPFDGDSTVAVALKQVNEAPKSMRLIHRDISRGLDEVILKALEKDPAKRYQNALEMARDLKRALKQPGGGFVNSLDSEKDKNGALSFFLSARGLNTVLATLACVTVLAIVSIGVVKISDILYGVDIPRVTGYNRDMAEQILKNYDLESEVFEVYDNYVSAGDVVRQNPAEGVRGRRNGVVELYVSLGSVPIELPDTVGMSLADARGMLFESGFDRLSEEYVVIPDRPVDEIVEQIPNNGAAQAGQIVTIKINSVQISTPQLIGKTMGEAELALTSVGLKVGEVTTGYGLDDAPDTVIVQYPSEGTPLVRGSGVNITVALPNPAAYYAKYAVYAPLRMNVRLVLETPSGTTREVLNELLDAETRREIEMQSDEAGAHLLYVYFDDELNQTERIEFQ